MNKIYKTVYLTGIIGIAVVPTQSVAQTMARDSILNPHISIEREYTPIIQDASKINTTPTRHQVEASKYPIVFENTVPLLRNIPYKITDMGSGDVDTDIAYNKHKGYLVLGAGTRSNLDGAFGYRFIETPKNRLDIFGSHNSTSGNVNFINPDPQLKKTKAKSSDTFIKADFSHTFSELTWFINASFLNSSYNYYGNPFWKPYILNPLVDDIEKKQRVNIVDIETGIASGKYEDFEYGLNVKYNNFSTKYGPNIDRDGIKANIFDIGLTLAKPIDANQKVGIKGQIMHQSISSINFATPPNSNFSNLSLIKAKPYYKIDGGHAFLLIGANIDYAMDANDKFLISPTVDASWLFNSNSNLYLTVNGGINDNNMVNTFLENRYVNLDSRVDISKTMYDAQIGVKTGSLPGLELDLHGGYKYTNNEHLFVPGSTQSWANVSTPIYANMGTGNIGGVIKTYLIPYTNLSLEANAYFYSISKYSTLNNSLTNSKEAWGLPKFRMNANLDFTFVKNSLLSVNYILEAGRKTLVSGNVVDMKNINELNVTGTYNFSNSIGVYAKVTNLFNQKYERYYGYTIQGTNFLGGVSLKF